MKDYPGIFLERLRKTKKSRHHIRSSCRDLNPWPNKHETGLPTTRHRRWMRLYDVYHQSWTGRKVGLSRSHVRTVIPVRVASHSRDPNCAISPYRTGNLLCQEQKPYARLFSKLPRLVSIQPRESRDRGILLHWSALYPLSINLIWNRSWYNYAILVLYLALWRRSPSKFYSRTWSVPRRKYNAAPLLRPTD
jgi:hypothetical protein